MNFLNPAYLWALTALAVPLAIHLLSRKEGKTIRMGSLRHVRETPTRQFRSIRLNEYLLLVLRMIVLALLSFYLAGWYLDNFKDYSKWLVVEPGLEQRNDLQPLFDSLTASGYEQRVLAPNFPEETKAGSITTDYASQLEELKKLPVEDVVVVATNKLTGFRGPRMSLPEHVKWVEVSTGSEEGNVRSVSLGRDSVITRKGMFRPEGTSFMTIKAKGQGKEQRDTVRVVIVYDPEFETDKTVLEAVFRVIRKQSADVLDFKIVKRSGFKGPASDLLIWLSDTPPPKSAGGLLYMEKAEGADIVEKVDVGRYRFTDRLNSEVATSRNLAVHLMGLLMHNEEAEIASVSMDKRVLPMRAAFGSEESSTQASVLVKGNQRSTQYLLAALLFFFLLERFIAYQRNQ